MKTDGQAKDAKPDSKQGKKDGAPRVVIMDVDEDDEGATDKAKATEAADIKGGKKAAKKGAKPKAKKAK